MLAYGIISNWANDALFFTGSVRQLTKSDGGSNQSSFPTDHLFMKWTVVMEYSPLETDHSFRLSVLTLKEGGSNKLFCIV